MKNRTTFTLLRPIFIGLLMSVSVNTIATEQNNQINIKNIDAKSIADVSMAEALGTDLLQCAAPKKRWLLKGESLAEGDIITLVVGGFSLSYTVNANATGADQWPMYLAMKVNEMIPASFARMGNVNNDYTPAQSITDNVIDVFVDDINIVMFVNSSGRISEYTNLIVKKIPEMIYSNKLLVPNVRISKGRSFSLYFTNRTDEELNVRVSIYDNQRNLLNAKHYLNPPFSASNDPINKFATLNARAVSRIYFNNSIPIVPQSQMVVEWNSQSCLKSPLSITTETSWDIGRAHGMHRQDYGPF